MIKYILFDMDNTLLELDIDWKKLTKEINEKYFGGKYNHLSPHQFFVAYFNRLVKKLPEWQHKEIMRYRLEAELAGIPKSKCFPYRSVLKDLNKKYRMGIVSGNLREPIEKVLEHCNIRKFFDVIISIEDAPASKPSPAPIKEALRKLKGKPSEAVYVGDHPDDIKAGRAAGVKTVGVYSHHFVEMKAARPNFIINDLYQLPRVLDELEKIEGRKIEGRKKKKKEKKKEKREKRKEEERKEKEIKKK